MTRLRYCVNCDGFRGVAEGGETVRLKNGRSYYKGRCAVCGQRITFDVTPSAAGKE